MGRRLEKKYPRGTIVYGEVVKSYPFGFFVKIEGEENLMGLINVVNIKKQNEFATMDDFPSKGSRVKAYVLCVEGREGLKLTMNKDVLSDKYINEMYLKDFPLGK